MIATFDHPPSKEYWEMRDNADGSHTVHWRILGTEGDSKLVIASLLKKPEEIIQEEIDTLVENGYRPTVAEDRFTLLIEYPVEGMGTKDDLDKRYRLHARMNQTLGWTDLGACDGGSIGSGTMEVRNS